MTEDQGLVPERGPERWPPLLRKAAGAKITQCWNSEVVTRNSCKEAFKVFLWQWKEDREVLEKRSEGKSGASSRGNSSSESVY